MILGYFERKSRKNAKTTVVNACNYNTCKSDRLLEDYKSFKQIDNEGKYLFDFVTISVWNARKQMIDWLSPHFNDKNELVDLFYAITNCHGWIKSSKTAVTVRLEALQQPRHHLAQEQLCRRLTSLMTRTPSGKRFLVEVGKEPV